VSCGAGTATGRHHDRQTDDQQCTGDHRTVSSFVLAFRQSIFTGMLLCMKFGIGSEALSPINLKMINYA